jgi:hypothetical protein
MYKDDPDGAKLSALPNMVEIVTAYPFTNFYFLFFI